MQYSLVDEAFDNSVKNNKKPKHNTSSSIASIINDDSTVSSDLSSLPNIEQDSISNSTLSTLVDIESQEFDHKKFIRNFMRDLDDNKSFSVASLLSSDTSSKSHLQNCKYCQMQIEYKLKILEKKKQSHVIQPVIEHIKESDTVIKGLEMKDIVIMCLIGILIIVVIEFLFRFRR